MRTEKTNGSGKALARKTNKRTMSCGPSSLAITNGLGGLVAYLETPLTPFGIAEVYVLLHNKIATAVEDLRKEVRARLMHLVEKGGEHNGKSTVLRAGELNVVVSTGRSALPSPDKLRVLLEARGLKIEDAMDATVSYTPSATKLETLVQAGKLKREEVEDCRTDMAPRLTVVPA